MARKNFWPLSALAIFWLLPDQWRFVHPQQPTWTSRCPARLARVVRKAAVQELVIGESRSGRVLEVNKFGAMLDLQLDRPGFLHVAHIKKPDGVTFINCEEVLKTGDELQVRVKRLKPHEIELTMLDLPDFKKKPLSEYNVGDELEGTVVTVRKMGVYIDVGAVQDGRISKENLNGATPESLGFEVGKLVKVKVQKVDPFGIVLAQV